MTESGCERYRTAGGGGSMFFLVAVTFFLLGPMSSQGGASYALIQFDDYPAGTVITDQYRHLGVVFSGEPNSQRILAPYPIFGDNLGTALLTSFTEDIYDRIYGSGTMTMTFVKPGTDIPASATNISFSTYFYAHMGQEHVFSFYDIDGNLLAEHIWWDLFMMGVGFPTDPVHKVVMKPAEGIRDTLLWVEDLSFNIPCLGTDADGDGHYTPDSCRTPNDDCDDIDPRVPGPEVCDDGKDNNCDGNIDCLDVDCAPDPLCFPRDCSGIIGD